MFSGSMYRLAPEVVALRPSGKTVSAQAETSANSSSTSSADMFIYPPNIPLFGLPKEVLYVLGENTPPNDVFNLSLTCKYALHALGAYAWPRLRDTPEYATHEWEFMKALSKDLPGFERCYGCKKLHTRLPFEGPRLGDKSFTCYSGGPQALDFGYKLHFGHVQAAMARHFYGGRHGIPLNALAISTPWRKVTYLFGRRVPEDDVRDYVDVSTPYFRKLDIEPLIKEDQLTLHTTQRYWFHVSEAAGLKEDFKPFRMEVCAHQIGQRQDDDEEVNQLIKSVNHNLDGLSTHITDAKAGAKSFCSPVEACKSCPTNLRVTTHYHGKDGVEMVIESWQNLGSGRDMTEPGWRECYGSREKFTLPDLVKDKNITATRAFIAFPDSGIISARDVASAKEVLSVWADVDAKFAAAQ